MGPSLSTRGACFQTTEGALIYVTYGGRLVVSSPELLPAVLDFARDDPVDPSSYYFRTHMTFETNDASASWLNGVLAVGVGRIEHVAAEYRVHRVL